MTCRSHDSDPRTLSRLDQNGMCPVKDEHQFRGQDQNNPPSNWFLPHSPETRFGDLVLLLTADGKRYLIRLAPGQLLHTHKGRFGHDDLLGRQWGDLVTSQLGQEALILEPSVYDLIRHLKRGTQIIYPKDAAYLVLHMGLRSGSRVIEAGTGSGGLTTALAWSVAPAGRVYSYEAHADTLHLARDNLERVGMLPYVELFERSIQDGFFQREVDALVLDVREPWHYLAQARRSLRAGGFFASLLPTTNQVSELLVALEGNDFADITVEELLLRRYKAVPERLRPEDEMVAHTGYLVFARLVAGGLNPDQWLPKERRRFRARQRAAAQMAEREKQTQNDGRKYPRLPLPG